MGGGAELEGGLGTQVPEAASSARIRPKKRHSMSLVTKEMETNAQTRCHFAGLQRLAHWPRGILNGLEVLLCERVLDSNCT